MGGICSEKCKDVEWTHKKAREAVERVVESNLEKKRSNSNFLNFIVCFKLLSLLCTHFSVL